MGRPYIIAGGMQATMTPEIIAEMVDYVFIGDGDDHLAGIVEQLARDGRLKHPNVYAKGLATIPPPAECLPTAHGIWTQGESGGTYRVEIARGCKYKCPFCCLSNLKPFREVPFRDLEPLIKEASGKRCSFFAPERTCHSEWGLIKEAMHRHECHDMSQDARLENIDDVSGSTVTFGIEGLSPRLGKTIGKPFSHDFIMEQMGRFVETRKNIARVAAYFIADLPGEDDGDWHEIRELFEKINRADWSRRLVFCPILNPLSPKNFTKMRDARIHVFRDYEEKWMRLLRRDGGQWGYRIVETLVWGPYERVMDVVVQRGGSSGYRFIHSLPDKLLRGKPPKAEKNAIARQFISKLRKLGLSLEYLGGVA